MVQRLHENPTPALSASTGMPKSSLEGESEGSFKGGWVPSEPFGRKVNPTYVSTAIRVDDNI